MTQSNSAGVGESGVGHVEKEGELGVGIVLMDGGDGPA